MKSQFIKKATGLPLGNEKMSFTTDISLVLAVLSGTIVLFVSERLQRGRIRPRMQGMLHTSRIPFPREEAEKEVTRLEWLMMERWSPYIVGVGIGVLSWLTFLLSDKPIGCSIAFARTSGMIERLFRGSKVMDKPYYK